MATRDETAAAYRRRWMAAVRRFMGTDRPRWRPHGHNVFRVLMHCRPDKEG